MRSSMSVVGNQQIKKGYRSVPRPFPPPIGRPSSSSSSRTSDNVGRGSNGLLRRLHGNGVGVGGGLAAVLWGGCCCGAAAAVEAAADVAHPDGVVELLAWHWPELAGAGGAEESPAGAAVVLAPAEPEVAVTPMQVERENVWFLSLLFKCRSTHFMHDVDAWSGIHSVGFASLSSTFSHEGVSEVVEPLRLLHIPPPVPPAPVPPLPPPEELPASSPYQALPF